MNRLSQENIKNHDGLNDSCIRLDIDNSSRPLVLHDILTAGQEYTFSAWVRSPSALVLNVCDQELAVSSDWQKKSVTFVADKEDLDITLATGLYYLQEPKLELGNRATAWKLADEDVVDASKTATNFLRYNNDGLLVANLTGDVLGKNVLISAAGIDLRNGSGILASYRDDTICLGKTDAYNTYITSGGIQLRNKDAILASFTPNTLILGMVSNNNVQITDAAVNIRSGNTILASYGGNEIKLGCATNTTTIKLLNGIGEIKAVDNSDYNEKDIVITGKACATLTSPEVASLTAEKEECAAYVRCYTNVNYPMVSIYATDPEKSKSGSIRVNTENILIYTGGTVEIDGALSTTRALTVDGAVYGSTFVAGNSNINGAVEIYHDTPFIDFHFGKNTSVDYTSRIVETASGTLQCRANWNATGDVTSNGYLSCEGRIKSQGTYDYTSTQAANVGMFSSYWTFRSTASSRRYKHDIESLGEDLSSEKLLNIPVHQYIYNLDYLGAEDQRYNTVVPGFIAEEVYENYPIAAEITDGQVEDWNHRMIIPPMLDLIQKLWKRVEELEQSIS